MSAFLAESLVIAAAVAAVVGIAVQKAINLEPRRGPIDLDGRGPIQRPFGPWGWMMMAIAIALPMLQTFLPYGEASLKANLPWLALGAVAVLTCVQLLLQQPNWPKDSARYLQAARGSVMIGAVLLATLFYMPHGWPLPPALVVVSDIVLLGGAVFVRSGVLRLAR